MIRNISIKFLSLLLLSLILFIGLYNIAHYDPIEGYDAEAHFNYVDYLARYLPDSLKLPSDNETREFFNPPIAYIVPSLTQVLCRNLITSQDFLNDCRPIYGLYTQILQLIIYLLTIFINLKTIKLFLNNKNILNLEYLIIISLFAVNYRTIIMIRGEPYILFFMSLLIYMFLNAERNNFNISTKNTIFFGFIIGMLALSRQWAFLLFPAFFLLMFKIEKKNLLNYIKYISNSFFVGFILSSWFYFSLYFKYGSFTAFNKESSGFNLTNQPLNFYFPNLSDIFLVFTEPIRPNFSNQFISVLYSDFWGDYWGYFSFTSRKIGLARGQLEIGSYFGRINLVSLIIFIFLLVSVFVVNKQYTNSYFVKYITLSIAISFLGYTWFLISYPMLPTGDGNKAVYIVQMFNLMALSGALVLNKLKVTNYSLYRIFLIYFIIAYIHNFDSYLSHFPIRF